MLSVGLSTAMFSWWILWFVSTSAFLDYRELASNIMVAHCPRRDGVASGSPGPGRSDGGDAPLLQDSIGVSGSHAGQAAQLHGNPGASVRGSPYAETGGAANIHQAPQVEEGGGSPARVATEESSRRRVGRDGGGRHGEPPTEVREDIASDVERCTGSTCRTRTLSIPSETSRNGWRVRQARVKQHLHDGGVRRGQPGTRYEGATTRSNRDRARGYTPVSPDQKGRWS